MFSLDQIRKMYDRISSIPWFWEIDAITCRATENSPYRDQAIVLLELTPESKILDVACGTGLNFKLIQKYLQDQGKLVGIDYSPKTLDLARKRISKHNWNNTDIVEINAAEYKSEFLFDAAICTFAIEIIPPYRETIDAMIKAVKPGGQIAFIGFKLSSWRFFKIFNLFFKWSSVFLGGADLERNVRSYVCSHCREIIYKEVFGGFYYILVVEKDH